MTARAIKFIDTHSHLQVERLDGHRAQWLAQAREAGLENILLCAGFTVIATVLLALIPDTLIGAFLHEAGTGGDLALTLSEGKDYLRIMLFGLPAFCLTTAYVSILRVTGDNRLPMKASVTAIFPKRSAARFRRISKKNTARTKR